MITLDPDSSQKTHAKTPTSTRLKVPRLASLLHRLQRAKDADGRPIPLLDELLFLLDDPPPGTVDRWQQGADLCASHGIPTSRMSVWRFYRAHILQWRREQNPVPPAAPPTPEETARLHDQARHLAAQRALEMLNDPRLSPGHLIGLIQNDNHRRHIELARDQFNDRVALRQGLQQQRVLQRMEDDIRDKLHFDAQMESSRKFFTTLLAIPPHTTPSRNIPVPPPPVVSETGKRETRLFSTSPQKQSLSGACAAPVLSAGSSPMANEKPVEGEMAIYAPEEIQKLIAFLWDKRGDMTAQSALLYVVLGAFAGLRPAEASGLDWKDVDFTKNEIHLTAAVAKIARIVPIHLNLQAFLQPYKSRKGLVVIHKKVTSLFRGYCDEADVKHIPNGLRRSYAAYRLIESTPEVVQAEMGMAAPAGQDPTPKPPTPASSAKYWAILP